MTKDKTLEVKKERLVSVNMSFQFLIKLILFSLLLLSIWYVLHYKHVYIYFSKTSKYKYFLFMLLVSVLMLMTTVAIGFYLGNLGNWIKITVILIVVYFSWLGYEYIGIGIDFRTNFGLLNESVFETNTKKGMDFFLRNVYWLIILYFISLPFESEK